MKLAIVGTGMIAGEALKALQYVPQIETVAIYARPQSRAKGEELARQYGIAKVFTDYDELLREDLDFVYIGNINSVHYEYGMKALAAGRNLIMEKPMCSRSEQSHSLAEAAQKQGLYVFEALTFLHAPFFQQLQELIPQLGPVRLIQCNYSKYSSRYDRYLRHDVAPVFDPACDGGTLLDLNIYNLNFVLALFGAPMTVHYTARLGFNGIDTSGTVVLSYPQMVASCTAAKDSFSPCFDMIQGEKGWLRINGSPDDLEKLELCVGEKMQIIRISPEGHRMVDEFKAFEQIYREKDYEKMLHYLRHSLLVADVAQKALDCIPANS